MKTKKRTKIVATIGSSSSSYETMKAMAYSGMDVCRVNFSHAKHDDLLKIIDNVKRINEELGLNVAILADLQGPKIRLGDFETEFFTLVKGSNIIITTDKIKGNTERVPIRYPRFAVDVKAGDKILIDDGKLVLRVVETNNKNNVLLQAENTGIMAPRKGVTLPDSHTSLTSLTDKDIDDLDFILQQDVHWIALSFIRSADDLQDLRRRIEALDRPNKPRIIAKIEKPQALDNIESIVDFADGIMIARGDLGIEIPMEKVPMAQKQIIKLCQAHGKPVIVATQMMESMINSVRPTRAEVNDVANAVLDGADALMLSGETSIGDYPVETISTMRQIIKQMESYDGIYYKHHDGNYNPKRFISDSILYSACELAKGVKARAIVVFSYSGYSATRLAGYRPQARIYMFSYDKFVLQQANLIWGIEGYYKERSLNVDSMIEYTENSMLDLDLVEPGDYVVNVMSTPIVHRGQSNTLRITKISDR